MESRTLVTRVPLSDVASMTLVSRNFCILAQKAFLIKSASLNRTTLMSLTEQTHAYQLETIPGIKDMIAKYK